MEILSFTELTKRENFGQTLSASEQRMKAELQRRIARTPQVLEVCWLVLKTRNFIYFKAVNSIIRISEKKFLNFGSKMGSNTILCIAKLPSRHCAFFRLACWPSRNCHHNSDLFLSCLKLKKMYDLIFAKISRISVIANWMYWNCALFCRAWRLYNNRISFLQKIW